MDAKATKSTYYKIKKQAGCVCGSRRKSESKKEVAEVSLQVKMTRMGGKVLEMKKVYKSYGDKVIMKGFDYTFKKGERIGIVGKNGTGKSTFLKIALQG